MTTVTLITTFSREVGHLPAYSGMMLMASVKPMKFTFLHPRLSISSFHSKNPQATDIKEGTPQHTEQKWASPQHSQLAEEVSKESI